MRMKALFHHHLYNSKISIMIFYLFFMGGTMIGSVLSSLAMGSIGVSNTVTNPDGQVVTESWSSGIVAFAIFMLIYSLIISQQGTRFLITRSVSRKEIFLSNVFFLIPLSAFMTGLYLISIYLDALVRFLLQGVSFRGLGLEIISMQAPNMNNVLIFFIAGFSLLFCAGSVSYFIGSCIARWKLQTIGVLIISGIVLVACMVIPEFFSQFLKCLKFMFTDEHTGLMIALKQIVFSAVALALAFPVTRRITAAKQQ